MDAPDFPGTDDFVPPEAGELRLVVDLAGYEGPLDLMLDLARREKLDLRAISMLALADQYLAFIHEAQHLRLELAGDYLVMAAWLTYLKSRLLLPERGRADEPQANALIEDLGERLRRLAAIRLAGQRLGECLGQAGVSFARGTAESVIVSRRMAWDAGLYDLLAVYAERRQNQAKAFFRIEARKTLSIPAAREILERLIGKNAQWCPIDVIIATIAPERGEKRSLYASSFAAALELAREGRLRLRQEKAFAPLYLGAPLGA